MSWRIARVTCLHALQFSRGTCVAVLRIVQWKWFVRNGLEETGMMKILSNDEARELFQAARVARLVAS